MFYFQVITMLQRNFIAKIRKKITTLDKKIKFLNSQIFKFNVQTKKLGFF